MAAMEAESATLYGALARHWDVGAPIVRLVFDLADATVAFATADGRLALAPVADGEPPQDRYRHALDSGRATIAPRRRPVPPLVLVAIDTAPLHLAAFGPAGFAAGGENGRPARVSGSGTLDALGAVDGSPIEAIVPAPEACVLVAAGGLVASCDPSGGTASHLCRYEGRLSGLALSPDGRTLALADRRGLAIRSHDAEARAVSTYDVGNLSALSWSPDGRWLAAATGAGGIVLVRVADGRTVPIGHYPTPVRSLAWSADSEYLATSGAFRIVAWDVATLADVRSRPEARDTGHAGLVPVEALAIHPSRPLVSASYANGSVVIAQIGARDELLVRAPGEAAVRAMQWSRDGKHLALGSEDGEAAIVTFPPQLFK